MDELFEELKAAERTLDPCKCGGRLLIRYQPGVTLLACFRCGVIGKEADWNPKALAEAHNKKTTIPVDASADS